MPWVKAHFNGAEVWALVESDGRPGVTAGRRPIRYSPAAGAKVYRASSTAVSGFGAVTELPDGVAADAPGAVAGTQGQARAGKGSGFGSAGTRTAGQAAAAASDAKSRLAALSTEAVVAFTDGACTGNPGPAGSGAVVKFADGRRVERHRALGMGTNNTGELTAIALAVEVLVEEGTAKETEIVVFTDSQYALGVLTKGWKAKANVELIAGIKAALRPWKRLRVEWVAGHVGIVENERADALARMGVEESRRR